ncbi:MAG: hypothetical protein ACE5E6_03845 [Phycisphaerae bacterium]
MNCTIVFSRQIPILATLLVFWTTGARADLSFAVIDADASSARLSLGHVYRCPVEGTAYGRMARRAPADAVDGDQAPPAAFPARVCARCADVAFAATAAESAAESLVWPASAEPAVRGLSERRSGGAAVLTLPPAPSSASLFLSAMVSIGAWHLVRSARHLYASPLPSWYHDGGPGRIGQAVALDLDWATPALNVFAAPAEGHVLPGGVDHGHRARGGPQFRASPASPRGPPTPAI